MVQKYIRELPLLPLRGLLVFPYMVINLDVGREKSIKAIEEAMIKDKHIFLASQKEAAIDDPEEEDIYSIGTIAEIKHTIKLHGGTLRVLVEGIGRGEITQYIDDGSERYIKAEIKEFIDEEVQDEEIEAIVRSIIFHFERYIKLSKQLPLESLVGVISLEEPGRLADVVASHMLLKIEEKQKIMEAVNLKDRLEIIYGYLLKELEILELENKISARVRNQMDKTQREYYLKEQIKAINQELGDKDDRTAEVEEYREKIEEANLPEEVETKVLKEVTKLEKMPPMVAEATVVRNYLDWIFGFTLE
ncbi:ATP-dependent protease La (LON) substrate-binding domain-containing protein [Desulfonispora thiosulfatigenes DSM 11270]|uniref:ATP-dependent protease La (LON) substrate-binding domain-containing protein n=1 Tax=Desulfonispora thiosulfatigenes DSM 11270 TaxID=656914 RepID=A0A1W1V816_DESTI|nr:ATP-dependent protease La (LON) substrate-binding domain-containing protein [Desulfonispora thiosulfatigenes DSM 11270]